MAIDYYRILGVIPGADEVVVRAAYRALAQRYHPDRFAGDPKEAHQRMAEINAAFAILGDPVKRAVYDAELREEQAAEYASSETEWQQEQAFSDAIDDLERRWSVACGIFPDLEILKQGLHRLSSKLSFAFVMTILESKRFKDREGIAQHLERDYLRRYFGSSAVIQDYAKSLILDRQKEAARALNDLVGVLGGEVDPSLLIQRIESDFSLPEMRERRRLCDVLRDCDSFDGALRLAEISGFIVRTTGGGFFKEPNYMVRKHNQSPEEAIVVDDELALVRWVRVNLCGN